MLDSMFEVRWNVNLDSLNVVYFSTVMLRILFLSLTFLALARPAHAYLDPGTGSYFVQILIAGLAGGGYLIVTFWSKIKGFFSSILKSGKKEKKDDGRVDSHRP